MDGNTNNRNQRKLKKFQFLQEDGTVNPDLIDRVKGKDWFIYQAGGLLAVIVFLASGIAGYYSFMFPFFPEHTQRGLLEYHLTNGALLSFGIIVLTVILDRIVSHLIKLGFIEPIETL